MAYAFKAALVSAPAGHRTLPLSLTRRWGTNWPGEGCGHQGGRGWQHSPRVLDTAARSDAGKWEELIEQAALAVPPPYRPARGRPIYEIRAGDATVWVAEGELAGPLRELVMTALAG